jgi:hypothetical protein
MAVTQYVRCVFGKSKGGYTYRNEGEALTPGARVMVLSSAGATVPVTVVEVDLAAPAFECKPILGLAPEAST